MAKVLNPKQKSGSVGPSTFLSSRYGPLERVRVKPLNPRTLAQENQRSIVAAVASEWRGLTEPGRAAWESLAEDLPGNLTGFQAYVQINTMLVSCGLPKLEEAPDAPAYGILSCAGLVGDDTPSLKLAQVADTVAPDKFIVEATKPVSQGVNNVNSRFRRIAVVNGHAAPAADLDLTEAYTARFGALKAGKRVVVRISPMTDGFKGKAMSFATIVLAHGA